MGRARKTESNPISRRSDSFLIQSGEQCPGSVVVSIVCPRHGRSEKRMARARNGEHTRRESHRSWVHCEFDCCRRSAGSCAHHVLGILQSRNPADIDYAFRGSSLATLLVTWASWRYRGFVFDIVSSLVCSHRIRVAEKPLPLSVSA